jgi:hypothetical protein
MADNSGIERPSSPPHEIVRKTRLIWLSAGAIVVAVLAGSGVFFSLGDWLLALGLCVGAVLALAILWRGPQWQVHLVRGLNSKDRFNLENEARKTLALILGEFLR